jgi:hypothetical protein
MPPIDEEVIDRETDDQPDEHHEPADQADKGAGKGKGKDADTETISKSELTALRRQLSEAQNSERFWADRARANGKPAEAEEEKDPDDEEEPDEALDTLVDEFSTQGIKALQKRGVVTKRQTVQIAERIANKVARQIIGQERQRTTTDQTIMGEFPELKDGNSELYKQTRIELKKLVDLDPGAAKSPIALYSAAATAKATLAAKAAAPSRRGRGEERYDYEGSGSEDEEAARRLRTDSQGSSRGRGGREATNDDSLPPQARQVLAGMFPDQTDEERAKIFRRGRQSLGR